MQRVKTIFQFLFEIPENQGEVFTKKCLRGLFFLTIAQIFLLFFVPYLSPFAHEDHLLGSFGFVVADFLIKKLFGLSAFAFPMVFIFFGLHDVCRRTNISETIQQLVASVFFLFCLNIALLNTDLFFTVWAGLFPRFFHAIIVHYWGENSLPSSLSVAGEWAICFLAFFFVFVAFRWSPPWKKSFAVAKKVFFRVVELKNFFLVVVQKIFVAKWKKWDFAQKFQDWKKSKNLKILGKKSEKENSAGNFDANLGENLEILEKKSEKEKSCGNFDENLDENLKKALEKNQNVSPKCVDLTATSFFLRGEAQNEQSGPKNAVSQVFLLQDEMNQKSSQHPEQNINAHDDAAKKPWDDLHMPRVINALGAEKSAEKQKHCVADVNCLTSVRSFWGDSVGEKKKEIERTAKSLVDTFKEFGIVTSVKEVITGPVITQYQITLEPGVRIQKVSALADNLALSLAAASLRIIAPIPGKSLIGVEIPNRHRHTVSLSQIAQDSNFRHPEFYLPIALGTSIVGKAVVTDLSKTPHLLIAGATGSGKSVCVNGIIASLLLQRSPEFVRFLMIDPKMVELNIYNGIPHLLHPVITAAKEASQALRWVLAEMQKRYSLLEKTGMRNIVSYNKSARTPERDMPSMPYIVVVIDELADLMMSARKDVEESLCRLAAMSRAVGIHLILATQRPSVDVITGLIKSNFPSRIAFKVSSKVDSRTIVDGCGAEKLLGKGDMLFQTATSSSLERLQGAFLSDTELWRIVSDLKQKSNGANDWIADMTQEPQKDDLFDEKKSSEEDELFREGLCIAVESGKISASFLQRRLKIGYNRAARMVELMEQKGMISKADGAKPREVLISSVPSF